MKAELERVFRGGATYAIYWKPDYARGKYAQAANYETAAQSLSKDARKASDSYVKQCIGFTPAFGGSGPIGTAGSSGVRVTVADTVGVRGSMFSRWTESAVNKHCIREL